MDKNIQTVDSISEIHDAEEKARKVREHVEKEREEVLAATKLKVAKMLDDAEEKARIIKENAQKEATLEIIKIKKAKLLEAQRRARKLSSMKISKEKEKRILSDFIKEVL